MTKNDLLERNNLQNLDFKPYQREAVLHNDKIMFNDDSQDLGMPPNPISNFYSSDEFIDLTQSKRLSSDNLSFLHLKTLNVRSIRNKFDVLKNYLNLLTHKFSVIALTETWLNDDESDNFEIPGYKSTKLSRKNKKEGIWIIGIIGII